jgi:hypothetical protein
MPIIYTKAEVGRGVSERTERHSGRPAISVNVEGASPNMLEMEAATRDIVDGGPGA